MDDGNTLGINIIRASSLDLGFHFVLEMHFFTDISAFYIMGKLF